MIQTTNNAVIPTKAKPRGGIFAGGKCEDPSTPLRSAQDDSVGWYQSDKLKFDDSMVKNGIEEKFLFTFSHK